MNVKKEDLDILSKNLRQAVSSDEYERKQASEYLESAETSAGYAIVLLSLIKQEKEYNHNVRLSGAIALKNFIHRYWKLNENTRCKIQIEERNWIKEHVLELMSITAPEIQKQLGIAIAKISEEDFPNQWPNLLNTIVTKLQSRNFAIIQGVLQTAVPLFEKYSTQTKSQKLWEEIEIVLKEFAEPITKLFKEMIDLLDSNATNNELEVVLYGSLHLISIIFKLLNYQDLPDYFADNMNTWMQGFLALLRIRNNIQGLPANNHGNESVLEDLKLQICDNIGLFAQKYEEEFQPYIPGFAQTIWDLLLSIGNQNTNERLVTSCILFLASVAGKHTYKDIFDVPAILTSLCEKIIVPHIEMKEEDVERFREDPEEYIARDLEELDIYSRRKASLRLLQELLVNFGPSVTNIFQAYIEQVLHFYSTDPVTYWKNKVITINLVTALASKAKTSQNGITKTTGLVNYTEFCKKHILNELGSPLVDQLPELKASCIKYLIEFRSQLPCDMIKTALPYILNHLHSKSVVVCIYAAEWISEVIDMSRTCEESNTRYWMISDIELQQANNTLLGGVSAAFQIPELQDNPYLMKTLMKSLNRIQKLALPFLDKIWPFLVQKVVKATENPMNPNYNDHLFGCIRICMQIICVEKPTDMIHYEAALFPVLQKILVKEVQVFFPYAFQILSLFLEMNSHEPLGEPYMELLNGLMNPLLWKQPGITKHLVRLLKAYIIRGSQQIMEIDKLESIAQLHPDLMIFIKSNLC